jgi:hypothetical protein
VDLWHDVGSVGVPALLVPLASSYGARLRMRPAAAAWSMAAGAATSLIWLLSRRFPGNEGRYFLGLEPIYAGLLVSLLIWMLGRARPPREPAGHGPSGEFALPRS